MAQCMGATTAATSGETSTTAAIASRYGDIAGASFYFTADSYDTTVCYSSYSRDECFSMTASANALAIVYTTRSSCRSGISCGYTTYTAAVSSQVYRVNDDNNKEQQTLSSYNRLDERPRRSRL